MLNSMLTIIVKVKICYEGIIKNYLEVVCELRCAECGAGSEMQKMCGNLWSSTEKKQKKALKRPTC